MSPEAARNNVNETAFKRRWVTQQQETVPLRAEHDRSCSLLLEALAWKAEAAGFKHVVVESEFPFITKFIDWARSDCSMSVFVCVYEEGSRYEITIWPVEACRFDTFCSRKMWTMSKLLELETWQVRKKAFEGSSWGDGVPNWANF